MAESKVCPSSEATSKEEEEQRRIPLGIAMATASGLFFACMSVCVRIASAELTSAQIVLVSGLVRWAGLAVALGLAKEHPLPPRHLRAPLLARCLTGIVSFCSVTFGCAHMPVGDAISIFMTEPIWASLVSYLLLKERMTKLDLALMPICLVSVVLVARPTFLFGPPTSDAEAAATDDPVPRAVVSLVVLVGAAFGGTVGVTVRWIKRRGGLHPAAIAHAFAASQTLLAPALLLLPGQAPVWRGLSVRAVGAAVGVGLLAVPNQLLFTAGLQRVGAGVGAMCRLIDTPASFVLGAIVFAEVPQFSAVVGTVLLLVCTGSSAFVKWSKGRGAAPSAARRRPKGVRRWLREHTKKPLARVDAAAELVELHVRPGAELELPQK